MHRQAGMTLVELLVATVVAATLLLLAANSAASLLVRARAGSVRSDLAADLGASVRRSVGASQRLVLCPSSDGENCDDSSDWSEGWVGFTEPDPERHRTAASSTVSRHGPIDQGLRLLTSSGRRAIVFQAGGANIGSNLSFTFCDRRGRRALEQLVLSNAGRIRREPEPGEESQALCANPEAPR